MTIVGRHKSYFRLLKTLSSRKHENAACAVTDIQWHPLEAKKEWIVSAPSNSKIMLWNFKPDGSYTMEYTLEEHERTVNRLSWHPTEWAWLFSASQDGTVKQWDFRNPNPLIHSFRENESVRDVQVCPLATNYFAAAYENGSLQVWDIRKGDAGRVRSINAHQGLVLSLDWHPMDKDVLASGGRDRLINVWDVPSGQTKFTVQTIASVGRVKWRPDRYYHVASSAALIDSQIHVWDLTQPCVPIASTTGHQEVVSGMAWDSDGDGLTSCCKGGLLVKHDLADSYFPFEHLDASGVSWSVSGQLASVQDRIDRAPTHHLRDRHQRSTLPHPVADFKTTGTVHIWDERAPSDRRAEPPASPFVVFAEQWRFGPASELSSVCRHNAQISSRMGRDDLATLWLEIEALFAPEAAIQHMLGADAEPAMAQAPLPSSAPSEPLADTGSISSISSISISLSPAVAAAAAAVHPSIVDMPDFRREAVEDMLEQLAEAGDVQTCVALLSVLRPHVDVAAERSRLWFSSYVELLHRHQLNSCAAHALRLSADDTVKQMHQKSNVISVACPHCRRPSSTTGPMCKDCNRIMTQCSVCQQRVSGLYIWCQGCGHGGHLQHLEEWFSQHSVCPTGCLHQCVHRFSFTTIQPPT